jgi:hypothetical protein
MARGKGIDPNGDGPGFRDDDSHFQLSGDEAQDYAIKKANAKPKKQRPPSARAIARGLRAQQHMNATQFREPEDRGPRPNYVAPAPGEPGGPLLPEEKPKEDTEPPKED